MVVECNNVLALRLINSNGTDGVEIVHCSLYSLFTGNRVVLVQLGHRNVNHVRDLLSKIDRVEGHSCKIYVEVPDCALTLVQTDANEIHTTVGDVTSLAMEARPLAFSFYILCGRAVLIDFLCLY
ncbi:hypothetical protein V6N11_068331 [Hibiscus sabdariffa]|uniref:Uncharacterized protein n=2 Tax=Hibiscus sabdariffa TaxID=183260 RepID=A0ABR2AP49_9ROSI